MIHDWILALREVYDRNNAGEEEADNLGQALYFISLVSDKSHPLAGKVLAELPRWEAAEGGAKHIKGRSDFAAHPVYQTKWLKFGLRPPHLARGRGVLVFVERADPETGNRKGPCQLM